MLGEPHSGMDADDEFRLMLRKAPGDDFKQTVILFSTEEAHTSGFFPAVSDLPGRIDRDLVVAYSLAVTERDESLIAVRCG